MPIKKPFSYSSDSKIISTFSHTFQHPCRFEILTLLNHSELTITELRSKFNLSRSSLRDHLQVLSMKKLIRYDYLTHFNVLTITDEGRKYLAEGQKIVESITKLSPSETVS